MESDYKKGYVFELMEKGGPTDCTKSYFKEAVDEMMRARTLCAKANQTLPNDLTYITYLEELFGRSLEDVRILTPFICDFGNRVKFGKNVFINHSAFFSASGGIELEDGVSIAPGVRIATINHDFNQRHMNDIKKLIIEKYSDELFLRVKEFCYGEIINGKINNIFPFLIKSVNVFKVEGDIIYFSVYMKAAVKVENDYNTYLKRFEFTAICEILLTTENSSFRINSLFPENLSCGKGIMSSMLVPIIYKDDLDVIAEGILEKYYPEALETPVAINPNTMAERMGIEIKTAKLSENDNIFGQMCFESCSYINYESNRTETARRKTMLIDPNCFLMRGYGFFNNTIIHECVHWEKHRFYFDLQRQFNSENCFIKCGSENMGENYKWMEKQANQLAPRILMPRKTVIKFVNTFIFENRDYFWEKTVCMI